MGSRTRNGKWGQNLAAFVLVNVPVNNRIEQIISGTFINTLSAHLAMGKPSLLSEAVSLDIPSKRKSRQSSLPFSYLACFRLDAF